MYVLWATPKGGKAWEEEIITETADLKHLEKAKDWALVNQFTNLRILTVNDGDRPSFVNALNI